MVTAILSSQRVLYVILLFMLQVQSYGQATISDFVVNDPNQNIKGLGRPAVAAMPDGRFAVAWQDYNDYTSPVTEIPRIAVQLFNASATPIGPINLFRGESRSLSIWTSDFLEGNADISFLPDGSLLLAVEHEGRFSIGSDDIGSSEVGLGLVSPTGQIVDLTPQANGVIFWLISLQTRAQQRPRLAVAPNGAFLAVLDGTSYDTDFQAVLIQPFDANGNFVGDFFTPHPADFPPQHQHVFADVGSNGTLHLVVWQDGRQDDNYGIGAQFYNNNGSLGGNFFINAGDPANTINIWPSVAMNESGQSVVVWADDRFGSRGDVIAQRFDNAGRALGDNIRVSDSEAEIYDRPEVAMRNDGSFMVVWTDSSHAAQGTAAFRARGRQFDASGSPLNEPFVIPNRADIGSGFANLSTDGVFYYCVWLDDRLGTSHFNVFAQKIGEITTAVVEAPNYPPREFALHPAFPNPFNPQTTIRYTLPKKSHLTLELYDETGRLVDTLLDGVQESGTYQLSFNGIRLTSGMYVLRMQAGEFSQSRSLMLIK